MDNNVAVCVVGGNLYVLEQSMSAGIRLDFVCWLVVAPIVVLACAFEKIRNQLTAPTMTPNFPSLNASVQ